MSLNGINNEEIEIVSNRINILKEKQKSETLSSKETTELVNLHRMKLLLTSANNIKKDEDFVVFNEMRLSKKFVDEFMKLLETVNLPKLNIIRKRKPKESITSYEEYLKSVYKNLGYYNSIFYKDIEIKPKREFEGISQEEYDEYKKNIESVIELFGSEDYKRTKLVSYVKGTSNVEKLRRPYPHEMIIDGVEDEVFFGTKNPYYIEYVEDFKKRKASALKLESLKVESIGQKSLSTFSNPIKVTESVRIPENDIARIRRTIINNNKRMKVTDIKELTTKKEEKLTPSKFKFIIEGMNSAVKENKTLQRQDLHDDFKKIINPDAKTVTGRDIVADDNSLDFLKPKVVENNYQELIGEVYKTTDEEIREDVFNNVKESMEDKELEQIIKRLDEAFNISNKMNIADEIEIKEVKTDHIETELEDANEVVETRQANEILVKLPKDIIIIAGIIKRLEEVDKVDNTVEAVVDSLVELKKKYPEFTEYIDKMITYTNAFANKVDSTKTSSQKVINIESINLDREGLVEVILRGLDLIVDSIPPGYEHQIEEIKNGAKYINYAIEKSERKKVVGIEPYYGEKATLDDSFTPFKM